MTIHHAHSGTRGGRERETEMRARGEREREKEREREREEGACLQLREICDMTQPNF